MWLVICSSEDAAAIWASEGLRRRGLEPLEVLDSDSLIHGVRWEHRVHDEGVSTNITIPGERGIRGSEVRGVLNRMSTVSVASILLIQPSDRYYVTHELQSLLLSWLGGLQAPVLNRPTPFGLSGRIRHPSEWVWLAARAGLPNPGYSQCSDDPPLDWGAHVRLTNPGTPTTTVIVVGDVLMGPPLPTRIADGCLRLSELSGAGLLGIEFSIGDDQTWTFAGVSTKPDLRLGGDRLLDALASALNGRVREAS